jgi:hypothetical protein
VAISSNKGPIAVVAGRREGVKTVLIQRPRRWDKPFSPDMSDADVDWVLTLKPFSDMDDSKFPKLASLRPRQYPAPPTPPVRRHPHALVANRNRPSHNHPNIV